MDGETLRRLWK